MNVSRHSGEQENLRLGPPDRRYTIRQIIKDVWVIPNPYDSQIVSVLADLDITPQKTGSYKDIAKSQRLPHHPVGHSASAN